MKNLRRILLRVGAVVILISICVMSFLMIFTGERRNGSGIQDEFDYLITVGLVQGGEDTPWKAANTASFENTFNVENGYALIYADAGIDQEKQIEAVRDMIQQNVDYILLAPVVETGWEEVLAEAKEARVPVILVHNQIDELDTSFYECWIGSDYSKQMKNAGKWLEEYLKEQGREEEEIDLVALQGEIGSMEQMERAEAYQLVLEKHTNWRVKGQQTGENLKERGKEVMKLFLEQEPELDVVIAENDEMALGAVEAIKENQMTCGPDGDIIVISFGGTKEGIQGVVDRNLNVTFEESPLQAPKVAEVIQRLEAGIVVDIEQYVNEGHFDSTMELEELLAKRTY